MKKTVKTADKVKIRIIGMLLILVMIFCMAQSAFAGETPNDRWQCPECSEWNTGNFCTNCGHPYVEKPKDWWQCPQCFQWNSGNFCTNCGLPFGEEGQPGQYIREQQENNIKEQPVVDSTIKAELRDEWAEELESAARMGFPTEHVEQAAISGRQYAQLLDHLVEHAAPDKLSEWQSLYPGLRSSDAPLTRLNAMAALFLAKEWIGGEYKGHTNPSLSMLSELGMEWTDGSEYKRVSPDLFGEAVDALFEDEEVGQMPLNAAAYHYNAARQSSFSYEYPYEYDPETNSFILEKDPTYAEALLSIVRLIDSAEVNYPSLNSSFALHTQIDPELMARAQQSQIVSMDMLPRLTGFEIADYGYGHYTLNIDPAKLTEMADWGFSSVRIMATYNTFFTTDCTKVKMENLIKLDNLIAEAIRCGMHLNLVMITLPGRDTDWDPVTNQSVGDFDMFVNDEKLQLAATIWRVLAARYKDIPGEYLSFMPVIETMNYDLSSGLPAPEYDEFDVARGIDVLIGAIREEDPDRFIIYEVSANGPGVHFLEETKPTYDLIEEKYDNVRVSFNFYEMPYIYAEITSEEGAHVDNNNHSLFKPEYPVTIYAAQKHLDDDNTMTIDGCLPAGTRLDMYLADTFGDGYVSISSDSGVLVSEYLGTEEYETSYELSFLYPYATSERLISVTLEEDTQYLTIACTGGNLNWSGIDVILPESYGVERWFTYTDYDAWLNNEPENAGTKKVKTSRVMLCPNNYMGGGLHITIHDDVSYTSDAIVNQSNKETIEAWGVQVHDFAPKALVRFEEAFFVAGTSSASVLRYYEDVLSMFDEYGYDWYSNDYGILTDPASSSRHYYDANLISYGEYDAFDIDLLTLFQKHNH